MHIGVAGGSGDLLDSGLVELVGVGGSSVAVDGVCDGGRTVGSHSGVAVAGSGHSDSRSGVTCDGHETSSRVGSSDWATVVCNGNATSSRLSVAVTWAPLFSGDITLSGASHDEVSGKLQVLSSVGLRSFGGSTEMATYK